MNTRYLHVSQDFGHHIQSRRPIVDIETTSDIKNASGQNEYERIDISCIGILVDDQIIQIHREPDINDISEFKREAISLIVPHETIYAFNKDFEYHGLRNYLGINSHSVEEIKPFKGRGWTKDKFFNELVGDGIVEIRMPVDPFHGDSTLAVDSWANGDIESILDHNVVCLLKEYYILENRDYLYGKYCHRIDANGWYQVF